MAYRSLNDWVLVREYCIKPNNKKCPADFCYDEDYYTCKYWKQEFKKWREISGKAKGAENDR